MHFCSETILINGIKSNIILEGGGKDNTILTWKSSGLQLREAPLMLKGANNFIAKGITFKVINLLIKLSRPCLESDFKRETVFLEKSMYGILFYFLNVLNLFSIFFQYVIKITSTFSVLFLIIPRIYIIDF